MKAFSIEGTRFECPNLASGLYVVATPIGNLSDISLRALKTLAGADLIACEDTRVTGKLLSHFVIKTPMVSYHEHNAAATGEKLLEKLGNGETVALVSDAGTPLISDPGFRLVNDAQSAGIAVFAIPGASAAIAALSICGLPTEEFLFAGFLPPKTSARKDRLRQLADHEATLVFYESPKRLGSALIDLAEVLTEGRSARICRELTKLHEEVASGTLGELASRYADENVRGEIVIVVEGASASQIGDIDALLRELILSHSVSRAAAEAAVLTGRPKRELYQRALELSSSDAREK